MDAFLVPLWNSIKRSKIQWTLFLFFIAHFIRTTFKAHKIEKKRRRKREKKKREWNKKKEITVTPKHCCLHFTAGKVEWAFSVHLSFHSICCIVVCSFYFYVQFFCCTLVLNSRRKTWYRFFFISVCLLFVQKSYTFFSPSSSVRMANGIKMM